MTLLHRDIGEPVASLESVGARPIETHDLLVGIDGRGHRIRVRQQGTEGQAKLVVIG